MNALEIGGLEMVRIHDDQPTHASACQDFYGCRARPAGADHADRGLPQSVRSIVAKRGSESSYSLKVSRVAPLLMMTMNRLAIRWKPRNWVPMAIVKDAASKDYLVVDLRDDQADVRPPGGEPSKVVGEVGVHIVVDQARYRWAALWMAVNNTDGQRVRLGIERNAQRIRLQDGHVIHPVIQLSGLGRVDTRQR